MQYYLKIVRRNKIQLLVSKYFLKKFKPFQHSKWVNILLFQRKFKVNDAYVYILLEIPILLELHGIKVQQNCHLINFQTRN